MDKKKSLFLLILGIFLLAFYGCSWFGGGEDEELTPVQVISKEAMEEYEDGNYDKAIELFQRVMDQYPYSKYAIIAELKIADAYFNDKKYEEALLAYQDFEKLHPHNKVIPYVIFQEGMCYYKRISSPDRDQSNAMGAVREFRRLIRTYPTSSYAKEGHDKLSECEERLAAHELYVAKFYYKNKHYKAALSRLTYLLNAYPDTRVAKEAEKYAQKCKKKMMRK